MFSLAEYFVCIMRESILCLLGYAPLTAQLALTVVVVDATAAHTHIQKPVFRFGCVVSVCDVRGLFARIFILCQNCACTNELCLVVRLKLNVYRKVFKANTHFVFVIARVLLFMHAHGKENCSLVQIQV